MAIADNMEASIMATLVSKDEGVPYVLAKAKNELHATVLRKIGADSVIFPEKEAGSQVAKSIVSSSFADWVALSPEYSVMEMVLPETWIGKSLEELNVRRNHGVNVIGLRAVSYTHLDVYKRQKMEFPPGWIRWCFLPSMIRT